MRTNSDIKAEKGPSLFDVKAETLVFTLQENGTEKEKVFVRFNGQHKRSYSKDVSHVETKKFERGEEVMLFNLNRDGIYDALPEALFHKVSPNNNQDGKEMAEYSAILKQEEEESRRFFMPFENALFDKRVELTTKENLLIQGIFSDLILGLLPDFWIMESDLPEKMSFRLCSLLPYAHEIVGNLKITAECLSYVLQEQVRIERLPDILSDNGKKSNGLSWNLGNGALGMDTICGMPQNRFYDIIKVEIGPLQNINAEDCSQNQAIDKLLKEFYGYFLPMEWEAKTNFIYDDAESVTFLYDDPEKEKSFLGVNTRL